MGVGEAKAGTLASQPLPCMFLMIGMNPHEISYMVAVMKTCEGVARSGTCVALPPGHGSVALPPSRVNKTGPTIDALLTELWDERAATRCLTKAIRRHGVSETITIEGSAAVRSWRNFASTSLADMPASAQVVTRRIP